MNTQIVIYGSWFDPSIVTRDWVIANGIVPDAEIHSSSMFEPGVVKLLTNEFEMLLMAPQLQLVPHLQGLEHELYVREVALALVNALPADTPMETVSLNLNWHVWPEMRDVNEVSRQLFFVPWNPTHKRFDKPDALFGSYLSTEMLDGRMKLSVRPVQATVKAETRLRLSFAFNFETQLSQENSWNELLQHLGRWEDAKDATKSLIRDVVALKPARALKGLANRVRQQDAKPPKSATDSGPLTVRAPQV